MSIRNRCMMLVTCLAITAGAGIGCAAPAPPASPTTAKVVTGVVMHAKASSATQKKLGITRWHGIVEQKTGAIVMDGSDAKGKVRFVTAIRVDKKTNVFHLDMHAPSKGSLAVDLATGKVLSNSISQDQLKSFATLMNADWEKHLSQAQYGAWGYVSAGLSVVGVAAGVVAAVAAAPAVITGAIVVGVVAGVGAAATAIAETYNNDKDTASLQADVKQLQQDIKDIKDAQAPKTDPAKDPAADPAKDPAADPAKDSSADPAPSSDPASSDPASSSSDPAQATSLPSSDTGGDLDKGGGLDTSSPAASTGGDTGSTGGDTGSTGGDTGSTGGDTTGGGFAVGTCRKAASSKTTKVRACTHY